ncbi:hypothetical protein ISCU110981_12810 [Isoptericola cucumis]
MPNSVVPGVPSSWNWAEPGATSPSGPSTTVPIETLSDVSRTMPRATVIIASVMTNDCTRSQAVPAPLTKPNAAPMSMDAGMMAATGQFISVSSMADAVEPTAITAPTDRSIPPLMITSVMPTARMPRGAK